MTRDIRAVILAAGRGRRMLPMTDDIPKCLLRYRNKKMLEHQLDMIRQAGISRILIVTGFGADLVRDTAGPEVRYVHNERYLSTNSLYSLFLARRFLDSGLLLMNSDVLAEREILESLLAEAFPNAVAVDFRGPFADGEMNVKVSSGFVAKIGRGVAAGDADGRSVQFAKFDKPAAETLGDEVARIVGAGCVDGFPSDAYGAVIAGHGLKAVDIGERLWFEIDTPADFRRAASMNVV